jgi:2-polyprenyl-3-methyl-5-hydroxy-6-metoxy-1,4-benzoquinol methylase
MFNFHKRSTENELLDAADVSKVELFKNLDELDYINRMLGGHHATLLGFEKIVRKYPQKKYTILDIGCGGGDTMFQVHKWAKKKGVEVEILGIDILPAAIEYCQSKYQSIPNLSFELKNFYNIDQSYDIVMCNLVCHHLYDQLLNDVLQTMQQKSLLGFVVNDLHRHPLAYYSIKILTKIFSKSRYVINDAPLSVARGFRRDELEVILKDAGLKAFKIKWVWAFRYLILLIK